MPAIDTADDAMGTCLGLGDTGNSFTESAFGAMTECQRQAGGRVGWG